MYLQILDEPIKLSIGSFGPVLVKEVIVLRGDGDEVDGADVEAEKHPVVDVVRHREARLVVAEVAAI